MMDNLAWGINLAVLGFFLAVVPLLPRERTWARTLVISITLVLWARYLYWRYTDTAPAEFTFATGSFYCVRPGGRDVDQREHGHLPGDAVPLRQPLARRPTATRSGFAHCRRKSLPEVDVFLTTYNEGREFVERGIVAAKALDYPRFTVWVLDDGRRDWLRDLCAERRGGVRPPAGQQARQGRQRQPCVQD